MLDLIWFVLAVGAILGAGLVIGLGMVWLIGKINDRRGAGDGDEEAGVTPGPPPPVAGDETGGDTGSPGAGDDER